MSRKKPKLSIKVWPYILAGLVIVGTMFGGLGTWAALAPLSGAVIAPGTIVVDSKRKTIQHLEGGIVDELLVRDGDAVEKGQLLIRLDDTRAKANLGIIDGRIDVLSARVARLKAERDQAEKIGFPEPLRRRRGDPDVDEILRGEEELFRVRRVALEGQVALLGQSILQYEEEIRGLQAQQRSRARQVVLIREELSGLLQLYEKGYVTRSRVLAYERAAEQLDGERGEYISNIARAEKSIAEARLRILQLEKDFRGEVVEELRDLEAKIFDLTRQRVTAVDELRRLEIRAPRAGTVVGTDVHTVGGVIAPAQPILDIVPGDDELVVEARVEPRDIDKVRIGQTAVLRLSAFDLRSTPELSGIVITVSADRLFDEMTGETYYLTRLRIPEGELTKLENLKLVPGMPVETFINTGERTALSYLLKPFTDGLARALKDG